MDAIDRLQLSPTTLAWLEVNPILLGYAKMGYFRDSKDLNALHMAFSPYRVPPNLTQRQVRRRISKYLKRGPNVTPSIMAMCGHRMKITIDGEFRAGFSFANEIPKNNKELAKLLRQVANFITAPDVPDKDVLGEYSPDVEPRL